MLHWIQTCICFQNIVTALVPQELLCSISTTSNFQNYVDLYG